MLTFLPLPGLPRRGTKPSLRRIALCSSQQPPSRRSVITTLTTAASTLLAHSRFPSLARAYAASTPPPRPSAKDIQALFGGDNAFPAEWPFSKEDFRRYDESSDSMFYGRPRLVYHIDEKAVKALSDLYRKLIVKKQVEIGALPNVLDICSSWISYLPSDLYKGQAAPPRVSLLGMNQDELEKNPHGTDFAVRDLNDDPTFPLPDNEYHFVFCAMSIDYLTKPLEVIKEAGRVLKPGGSVVLSFSNRLFVTKAVALWTGSSDLDHMYYTGNFIHFSKMFSPPKAYDISPSSNSDPLYYVTATKL